MEGDLKKFDETYRFQSSMPKYLMKSRMCREARHTMFRGPRTLFLQKEVASIELDSLWLLERARTNQAIELQVTLMKRRSEQSFAKIKVHLEHHLALISANFILLIREPKTRLNKWCLRRIRAHQGTSRCTNCVLLYRHAYTCIYIFGPAGPECGPANHRQEENRRSASWRISGASRRITIHPRCHLF